MRKIVFKIAKGALFLCLLLMVVGICTIFAGSPDEGTAGVLLGIPLVGLAIGQTTILEKTLKCTAAITTAYTIAKFGADDDHASLAVAATDPLIGIFQHTTTVADEPVRVMLEGISRVVYGGTVTRGQDLTCDGSGKAVAAAKGDSIIGQAMVSGVVGDIGFVHINQGQVNPSAGVDGIHNKYVARATYDFAVSGGATGDHPLGVTIPNKAIITRGIGNIITPFVSTSNDGTIALKANSAGDLLAAVDADTLSGVFDLIPVGTAATMVKLTDNRELTLTVAVHALTAGKAVFFVEYVLSD